MADETLTTSLPGVVNDIRLRAYKEIAAEGVMKSLCKKLEGTGFQVSEPVFDPTGYAGTSASEGTDISDLTEITTTRKIYTASEWAMMTFETYDSMDEASESTRDFHAKAHGFAHAQKLEQKCLATFASFSHSLTATGGLSWAKVAAGRALLEGGKLPAPKPYNLVVSPNAWYYFTANTVGNTNYGPVGTLADSVQQKYHVGSIVGGIEVFQTAYLAATSNQVCGLFSREAIGLFIPRDFKFESQQDVSKRGYELVSTLKAGARARITGYGVKMTVKATDPS